MSRSSRTPSAPTSMGQLRIIAGQWRSRKLQFPDAPGLRPTPDRVRETLFNWLAAYIEGARVLDIFAGSGAITLEALSRGASYAVAVDANQEAVNSLKRNLATLECHSAEVILGDALRYLQQPAPQPFDLVFVDPPFHQGLLAPACEQLQSGGWLSQNAWVYTESEQAPSQLNLPSTWRLHREKHTGQVYYALWQCQGA